MFSTLWQYLFLLAIAVVLNTLFGLFNNILLNGQTFSPTQLRNGLIKAALFCLGVIGISYIFTVIQIPVSVLTPKAIMETAILYYTAKVTLQMKDTILPKGESLSDIKEDSLEALTGGVLDTSEPPAASVNSQDDKEKLEEYH